MTARLAAELRNGATIISKFGVVSILSNFGGYIVYLVLTAFGVPPVLAMTMLYAVSLGVGYFGNGRWTFSSASDDRFAFARYAVTYMTAYLINVLMLIIFAQRLHISHQLVQAGAIIVIGSFLFLALRFFVFPAHRSEAS